MIEPTPLMYLGSFIPLGFLFLVGVFIFFIVAMVKDGGFNFNKFYFTIVSFAGIIGMVVAFGIVLYNIIISNVISDEEYLAGRGYREVQQCDDPYFRASPIPLAEGDTPEPKTPEEIAECEAEAKERVLNQRKFSKKEATVGGLVRGAIFWLLYFTHYPKMRGLQGEAPSKPTPKKRTPRKVPAKKKPVAKKKTTRKKTTKK